MQSLEDRHKEWLFKKEIQEFQLLSIDSLKDYVTNKEERQRLIQIIDSFVQKISSE